MGVGGGGGKCSGLWEEEEVACFVNAEPNQTPFPPQSVGYEVSGELKVRSEEIKLIST